MSDVNVNGIGRPADLSASISPSQKSKGEVVAINDTVSTNKANKANKANQGLNISAKNGGIATDKNTAGTENNLGLNANNQDQVNSAITKLNDYVQLVQRNLQFKLDETSGKTIITVVDKETSKVIRQIPDDVALKLAQDLQQSEPLSLFKAKV